MAAGLAEVVTTSPAEHSISARGRSSRYTDVRGIAEHLAITERHVRRLVLERRIPHRNIGNLLRFDIDEVERWMDTLRRGPAPEPAGAPAVAPVFELGGTTYDTGGTSVTRVVTTGFGFVATGQGDGAQGAWRSRDGVNWRELELPANLAPRSDGMFNF